MMTTEQLAEIRNYLLVKNLPIDILMEVQDHFVAQITELRRNGDLGFSEAFGKAKNSWKPALNFPKFKIQYDLNDSTYFLRRIREEQSKVIATQSLYAPAIAAVLLLISAYMLPQEWFLYLYLGIFGIALALPITQYFRYLRLFRLIKRYDNYKLSIHQDASLLSLILLGSYMPFIWHTVHFSGETYKVMHGLADNWMSYSIPLLFFGILWLNAYCYISQRRYIRQIEKVALFLKNLTPSN